MRITRLLAIICMTVVAVVEVKAQCPSSKYGIVPVWPQGWSFADKDNWYHMMSEKGMGYSHSILTWPEGEALLSNGQVSAYVDYIAHLRNDYRFKYHLLIRNPSTTVNPVPAVYAGMNFEDPILTNAFYNFASELIDSFAVVLDYVTVGGESDIYFKAHPNEMDEYVELLSDIAAYVHTNHPGIKFATVLTYEHGIRVDDRLWRLTKNISDMLAVTYWPLNSDFTVIPSAVDDIEHNMNELLIAADGKPIIIKEAGLPSSVELNSSEALQARFVEELFRQTMSIDQIEIVGWDFLADFDKTSVDYWIDFQQIFTPGFKAYMQTLGLLDTLGNSKPAYVAYQQMLDEVCSQTAVRQVENKPDLNIWPNPANNILTIEYGGAFLLEIFNIEGRRVMESSRKQTGITELGSGVYIVVIKTTEGELLKVDMLIKQ